MTTDPKYNVDIVINDDDSDTQMLLIDDTEEYCNDVITFVNLIQIENTFLKFELNDDGVVYIFLSGFVCTSFITKHFTNFFHTKLLV